MKLYNQNCNSLKNGQMQEKQFIKILQKTNEKYIEEEELSFDN